MSIVASKIEEIVKSGYCLHGSNVMGQKIIRPRQALCVTGLPERNLLAVYADFDLCRPLLHATTHRLCGGCATWMDYADHVHPLVVEGGNIGFGYGSIYALPVHTFFWSGREFVSRDPVEVHEEFIVGKRVLEEFSHFYDIRFPIIF